LKRSFPFTGSPPEAAGVATAEGAGAGAAGAAVCANEVNDKASIAAKLKIKLLEIELWLPTFFILYILIFDYY
jgi:hypothetical protein